MKLGLWKGHWSQIIILLYIDNENLPTLLEHFKNHPKDALEIINNAHQYIKKFLDKKKEFHIGILVLAKYFYYSRQLELDKERDILELIK